MVLSVRLASAHLRDTGRQGPGQHVQCVLDDALGAFFAGERDFLSLSGHQTRGSVVGHRCGVLLARRRNRCDGSEGNQLARRLRCTFAVQLSVTKLGDPGAVFLGARECDHIPLNASDAALLEDASIFNWWSRLLKMVRSSNQGWSGEF